MDDQRAHCPCSRFRTLLGATLIVQAVYTHRLLRSMGAALQSPALSMRFHYPGMPLLPLPPGDHLAWWSFELAALQATLGALMATGCCTRFAASCSLLLVLGTLLADQSFYQNHYYLLCQLLFCFGVSRPSHAQLVSLRFLTSVPYVYGALAKLLSDDWMFAHQPAARWCADELPTSATVAKAWLLPFFKSRSCAAVLSYGGLMVDALMLPVLLMLPVM